MRRVTMGYEADSIARPIDACIGPFAGGYLEALKGEGRASATLYETWRELGRLGEEYPGKLPVEVTTFDIEQSLALRCSGKSLASRRKVRAIVSGFFNYLLG